jgi:hypothetical protein
MSHDSNEFTDEFRETTIGSLARIETHVGTILARQVEDRETSQEALKTHILDDDTQFRALREKHEAMNGKIKWLLGGLSALGFLSATAVAAGLIKF